jgi:lipid-A-disaccharide synthase
VKPLLVVAGEASGDLHGAELLREIKARRPELRIIGVGGAGMSPYLDRQIADIGDLGVVGFVEVLRHIPKLLALKRAILRAAAEEGIGAALLIDYKDFNFRLATSLRKSSPGVRLHQYVCPQVWAWKAGRIPAYGRTLDTLYCLFDFEPPLFKGLPVEALWMGHPLVEVVKAEVDRETFFRETGLDALRPLVALLPGSRREEIQRLLPPLVELVKAWREDPAHEGVQWVLPLAPTLARSFVETFIGDAPIVVVAGQSYAPRAYADAALVCSGTATLETALLGTPFAILYRMNPLTLALARRFVKVPFFGLANVVAGREVAPELLQGEVNPARLGQELSRLLQPERRDRIHRDLAEVRTHLGEPGAAGRVAEHLLSKLG